MNVRSIENPDKTIRVILSARDEGSSQYYEMPYLDINPGKESSKYIRLNVSGEAKSLKITFQNLNGDSLWLSDIHFNVARPFEISVFRVLICLLYTSRCV